MSTLTRRQAVLSGASVLRVPDEVLTEESVRAISRLPQTSGRQRLLLDLGRVRIPTAGGLGALVALHKGQRACGGSLTLLNVSPWAFEVFSLTRLTEILDVRAA
jgi:anti-anti-sigma regulatory factor